MVGPPPADEGPPPADEGPPPVAPAEAVAGALATVVDNSFRARKRRKMLSNFAARKTRLRPNPELPLPYRDALTTCVRYLVRLQAQVLSEATRCLARLYLHLWDHAVHLPYGLGNEELVLEYLHAHPNGPGLTNSFCTKLVLLSDGSMHVHACCAPD